MWGVGIWNGVLSADSAKLATMIALLKRNPHYQFRKLTSYPGLKK